MKKATEEWCKAAKDDLDVIERIVNDDHLSHIVAFHAQQCIEKIFKASLEEFDIEVPKVHSLVSLFGKIENLIEMEVDIQMLQTLDSLYIDARYPGELGLLPNGKPTRVEALQFQQVAKDVFTAQLRRLKTEKSRR